ncbi:hypothetical protein BDA96_04G354300 [Sorghum bicolor]|uniref:Uncharacterized protein n=1 Tax=Sorghum bicolor TaxID=4558 RepID=A0A921RA92_SORBI|nr:hypothetical protein BDA96_04G354300 [Sorghum bicolor]
MNYYVSAYIPISRHNYSRCRMTCVIITNIIELFLYHFRNLLGVIRIISSNLNDGCILLCILLHSFLLCSLE